MKPLLLIECFQDIVTQVTKKPYRDEPLTEAEWDMIMYRTTILGAEQINLLKAKEQSCQTKK